MNNYKGLPRNFFSRHVTTNEPIKMIQGKEGYFKLEMLPNISEEEINKEIADLNTMYGNTESDVDMATICSMYGWTAERVSKISPYIFD